MTSPLTYRSPKTEIRESPIHGKGFFARVAISTGEVVAVKGGHVMTAKDLFIGPVSAEERDGAMVYTNHSCEPNIALQGQIVFVAMRDIAAGEELTHDWATTDAADYKMQCNCRSPSCRGIITGKDWMKPELQKKYEGWFCWFLQRRIDGMNG
ncbi:MAG TPA: SET domain-containing protein-lysine N-methyltransferase [Longimicrobiales bacterium]|nr:SET domain-containing protein-lysine N-methyltransferase [Longimicrobiales bacterium]